MSILTRLTLLGSVLAAVSLAGCVNPAPPFSETVADPTSYDQAVTDLGGNQYLWDITYNGADSLADPSGWPGVADGSHAAEALEELQIALPEDVGQDSLLTVIHTQYDEDSEWVNNTPELLPSVLLSISMLPLGIAYLRGRRRKES